MVGTSVISSGLNRKCILLLSVLLVTLPVKYVHSGSLESQRANYLYAEAALKKGDLNAYDRFLEQLTDYPLYPYLLYRKLKRQSGQVGKIQAYLSQYEDSRYAKFLRNNLLRYFARTGEWLKFVENFRETKNTGLSCNYYRALFETGQKDTAMVGARELWLVGESLPEECDVLFSIWKTTSSFSSEMVWQRIRLAMRAGNTGLAKHLSKTLPASDRALVDFWLTVHKNPKLLVQCEKWRQRHSKIGWVFAHAIDRLARNDLMRAISIWDARQQQFKLDPEQQYRINQRLGMSLAFRRHELAFERLNALNSDYEDSSTRAWRVRAALYKRNWFQVKQALNKLAKDEKSELKWKYWRARAEYADGDLVQAQNLFAEIAKERDYYGFLAADRLRQPYEFSDHPILISSLKFDELKNSPAFRAVSELLYFGQEGEAMRQWWHAIDQLEDPDKMLAAKLAQQWGLTQLAVFSVAKAKAWDDLSLRFPLRYTQSVMKYSKQSGIASAMILGLIRQESIFNSQVKSPAGARGLMQIMPATGRQVARELNEKWKSANQLYDPDLNVRYGVHYLQGLLERFGQNFAMAAAGYNAGPHRVKRWRPEIRSIPADVWVESIPYLETRRYVRYVLGYSLIYQYRLGAVERRISSYMPEVSADISKRKLNKDLSIENHCIR